jgi:hypothetical protein
VKDSSPYELWSQEYSTLREEITQSIKFQHQFLMAGYGAAGIFASFVFTNPALNSLLVAVPFLFAGMVALWLIECNRMVRASYYIAVVLWPALQKSTGVDAAVSVGWEFWIRKTDGIESEFRHRQHVSQTFVVIILPSILSLCCVAWGLLHGTSDKVLRPCMIAACVAAIGCWCYAAMHFKKISDLGQTPVRKIVCH